MDVEVLPDKVTLGQAAAQRAATILREAIAARDGARIVAATGASQFEFLDALARAPGIDWKKVEMFHLDEYLGLPITHPASFRRYLRERLIDRVGIGRAHLLGGQGDVPADVRSVLDAVSQAIAARPIDVAFVGIGENGHLAFNDPPADFETEAAYLVVELDEACRRQQVGEGWFAGLDEVPTRAISMSVRQILRAREILCVVPDRRKAEAVRDTLTGPVTPRVPASALRQHPHATLYLDPDSASLLPADLRGQGGGMKVELPGLFDLQVNGFAGVDFNDPVTTEEDLGRAIVAMRATGVTRFLPTLITGPPERFSACARRLAACSDPAIAGIHMEGPYLAPEAVGAHPAEHLALPSFEDFSRRQDAAGGRIRLVTLAPEVPGALRLIERLVAAGVRVAIGHSAAPAPVIGDAVRAGATLSTHLGNACPLVLPRHPNLLWEQLAADGLTASLIVDGHHLPPSVVKVMVRAKSLGKTVLVTDAVAAAAQPPGRYRLGQVPVELSAAGRVTIVGTERLAGSALTLDVALANTARFTGCSLQEVAPLASTQPAAAVGLAPAGRVFGSHDPASGAFTVERVEP